MLLKQLQTCRSRLRYNDIETLFVAHYFILDSQPECGGRLTMREKMLLKQLQTCRRSQPHNRSNCDTSNAIDNFVLLFQILPLDNNEDEFIIVSHAL